MAERLQYRSERCSRKEAVDRRLVLTVDPCLHDGLGTLAFESVDELVAHAIGPGGEAQVDHARHDELGDISGELVGRRPRGSRAVKRCLLNPQQRAVKVEKLPSEALTRPELANPAPALGPDIARGGGGSGCDRHQIFSRLTRNALNSGVRALASPTNGVSALASQYRPWLGSLSAEMPM